MVMNEEFEAAAREHVSGVLEKLKRQTYQDVAEMPHAAFDDIVIAGKEVQLTIFKQDEVPSLPGAILITAQIVRAALGGVHSFHYEQGLVFEENRAAREASEEELRATA